jgi:hypothetical protein
VAYAVNDTIWFAWGQNLTGRPTGTQDVWGACPLGGSVHITGSNTNSGVDVVDLTFDFANCHNAASAYDLTFTASVAMHGAFDSNTQIAALTFNTSSLEAAGSLDYWDTPQIAETCDLASRQEGTGDAWHLTGQLCGRPFDSETALDAPGGNTGSGGASSGTGGSSSGSCSCFCPDGRDCTGATTANPCGYDANGIPEPCGCPVGC